ncbi:DUF4252 domain-containing protein [Flavobacterium pallidum]|uniref:DUF4252 domain-containing protein n=1 Tax=Flavobacterium pallidum TaxID=2172098 RepID=A0A2S1SHG6_9FLAO|nr:DUF4252 domain-containing protein [Flavobacterium pallidum]AWI25821.1 DUF4252 domain-containing protein [Flavobacterium pallidum]
MKRLLISLSCSLFLTGCNSEPTLQKYFIKKSGKSNFIVLDLTPNIFKMDKLKLTADEKKALDSFDKMNMLFFKSDSVSTTAYDTENKALKNLLNDKKYELLMRVGSGSDGASISYVGKDDEHIDEFVIYAAKKENGIAVVRVLGNDMDPSGVMTLLSLLKNANIDQKQLEPLKKLMK